MDWNSFIGGLSVGGLVGLVIGTYAAILIGREERDAHGPLFKLDRDVPPAAAPPEIRYQRVCAWCNRILTPGDPAHTTHTICPACRAIQNGKSTTTTI